MICAVVLAAGRSVRMGQQKLLLPIRGTPMIRRIVDEVRRSSVDSIVVILGADGPRIRDALCNFPFAEKVGVRRQCDALTFISNPNPTGDMLSSVRCGIRALPDACNAVLLVLGDQPGLTVALIEKLIDAFRSSKGAIIVPVHNGKRGHPLLFSARFGQEVLEKYDELGLHALLNNHPAEVVEVETGPEMNLQDLDTPRDYDRFIQDTGS